MKEKSRIGAFILIFSIAWLLSSGNLATAAVVSDVKDSLATGQVQDKADEAKNTAAIKIKKEDTSLVDKLKKLLAEIKAEDPKIDVVPAAPAGTVPIATDEASLLKFARHGRQARYVSLFKKAYNEFENGKYEVSFKSFKYIYEEFNRNPKALCYMVLACSMQGKFKEAVELATELLDIVKSRKEIVAMREELAKDIDAFETSQVKLTDKQLAALNKKVEASLKKINDLYPTIANVPKNKDVKKPEFDKNAMDNILNNLHYKDNISRFKQMREAEKLYEKGDFAKSYDAFAAIFEQHPDSLRPIYYMALCKLRMGRPDEAAKLTSKLIELIKDSHEIRSSNKEVENEIDGKKDDKKPAGKQDKPKKPAATPRG